MILIILSSNSAFIHSESVSTVGADVGHLLHAVNAVRNEAAAEPKTKETTDEGSEMLDETGVRHDGRGHLLVTPRAHQGHGVRSKLQTLAGQHIIMIIVSFFNTVVTL